VLDRVQMKTAQFSNNTKDSDWVNLALRRMTTRLCALFKVHSGEGARKAIRNRLRKAYYLSRVGHVNLERKKQNVTLWGLRVQTRL